MLARSTDQLPDPGVGCGRWLMEPKWDGYRAICLVYGDGKVRIVSRNGTDLTRVFPEIAGALAAILPRGTAVDGEIVCWRGGKLDFHALQRRYACRRYARALARSEPAHLIVFDVLELACRDLRQRPWTIRRHALEALFLRAPPGSPLTLSMQTADFYVANRWFDDLSEIGVEGLIIKPAQSRYEPGQRLWLKLKTKATTEAIIGGVTGSLTQPRQLVLGRYDSKTGRLRVVGTTTRISDRAASEITPLLLPATGHHPWPDKLATSWRTASTPYLGVEPGIVVEISADLATDRGRRFRHAARYLRVLDVAPEQVPCDLDLQRREQP
ncbi:ATP-dependent DNA ligase [Actinopolymorpha pittospori]|nr:ATP-dependent DNA ligase [Actinopolymorpha pittospori]